MRNGISVIETLFALALIALLAGFVAPSVAVLRERVAVRSASTEMMSVLATARHLAVARQTRTAVLFDETRGTAIVVSESDTIYRRELGATHGVALAATRDSIAYGPTGRGYGAANTSIVIARGRAADTIIVSRLGRVRR